MGTRLRALAMLLSAIMLTACGLPGSGTTPTVGSDVGLEGGTWVLEEGTFSGRSIDVPDGSRITLTPGEDDQVGGSSGCNFYGATVDIDGKRADFTIMSGTDMGCASEVLAAEKDYLEAFERVTRARRQDGTLHLSGPDVTLEFELSEAVPIDDISGVEWHLESLVVDGARTPARGEPASLLLAEDGTVTASTGCRELHGNYDTFGDQINFPNLRGEGECRASLQDQDSHIIGVFGDGFRAELEGEALRLSDDGDVGLIYRRSS